MISEVARGNCKNVNMNSNKIVTKLDLRTKDNVTRDSFQIHIKRFAFIVAPSVSDNVTDINRIQEYKVNAGITLDAEASGRHWGRVG